MNTKGFTLVAGLPVPALPDLAASKDSLALAKKVNGWNFYGQMGKIVKNGKWRVDRQKRAKDHMNLQIQRNGAVSPSTVACVLVPSRLSDELQGAPEQRKAAMSKELGRAINKGFHLSEKSRGPTSTGEWEITVYRVIGSFSS